jgi:glucosamine kinase
MRDSNTECLFGIDGGGSTCRFALLTGSGRFDLSLGAANAFTDRAGAIATLREGIAALAAQAGLTDAEVAGGRLHAGLAGIMTAADAGHVAGALPVRQARVTDDRPTSLRGALGGADGTLAAIGTGSFFGRQHDGETRFIGGWGFRLGDEASGAWLGRSLLSAVLHAVDGLRPRTPLAEAVLAEFDGAPADLVTAAQDYAPRDFAALAARAVDAAGRNDPLAADLMRDGAAWLMAAVTALGWTRGEPLCLIGGLGPHYAAFLDAEVSAPLGTALDGALALAADLPPAGSAP